MTTNLYIKKILLFIISVLIGLFFNYKITSELLAVIDNFPSYVYIIILVIQIIGIYEVIAYFLFKWNKRDKLIVLFIYFFALFIIQFSQTKIGATKFELNPLILFEYMESEPLASIFFTVFIKIIMIVPMPIVVSFLTKKKSINFFACLGIILFLEFALAILQIEAFNILNVIFYTVGILFGFLVTYYFINYKK